MTRRRLPPLPDPAPPARGGLRAGSAVALMAVAAFAAPVFAQTDNSTPPADKPPKVDLDKLKRPAAPATPSNLFGARSWEPKVVPKKVAPPPPPPPQAPPLPFTYVGRWTERGDTIVMLSRAGRNYTVRAGEQVDPTYLLERIENDKVVLRYVPLDQAQVLPFAGGPPPAVADQARPNVQLLPQQQQKRGAAPRDADDEED